MPPARRGPCISQPRPGGRRSGDTGRASRGRGGGALIVSRTIAWPTPAGGGCYESGGGGRGKEGRVGWLDALVKPESIPYLRNMGSKTNTGATPFQRSSTVDWDGPGIAAEGEKENGIGGKLSF